MSQSNPFSITIQAEPVPSWITSASVHQWVAVPNSNPSTQYAPASEMGGVQNIVQAWCGAEIAGTKYILHGGGHADYGGNEWLSLDLRSETPSWSVLIPRTPVGSLLGGSNYYADGLPTSRHTYYGFHYIPSLNRILRFNGDMGFAYNGTPVGGAADVRTTAVDAFNLGTNLWEVGYSSMDAEYASETSMARDPATDDVYGWDGATNRVHKWTAATNTGAAFVDAAGVEGRGGAMVVDAVAGRLVRFGGRATTGITTITLTSPTKATQTATGPAAAAVNALSGEGAGIAHDATNNVAYILDRAGANLYKVRLSDFYSEQVTPTGATPASPINQVWGRLRFCEALGGIVYIPVWNSSVYFMRTV